MRDTDKFLAHFGVKGMHWGIRKEAKAGLKRFASQAQDRIQYVNREITEEEYKSLSSKPVRVADKGSSFSRVAFRNATSLSPDFVYVTTNAQDHNTYVALLNSKGLAGNPRNEKKLNLTISTDKSVVSPGMKERVDTFVKTLDSKIVDPNDHQEHTGREYLVGDHESPVTKALSNRELGLKYYQTFAQSQHARSPLTSEYVNRIKKKGYTALIDDADRGFMAKTPLMIFPKESGARIVEVKPITVEDTLRAKAALGSGIYDS
jgi:hypothetical protein